MKSDKEILLNMSRSDFKEWMQNKEGCLDYLQCLKSAQQDLFPTRKDLSPINTIKAMDLAELIKQKEIN